MTGRSCRHQYIDRVASPIVALKEECCGRLFALLMQDLHKIMVNRIRLELVGDGCLSTCQSVGSDYWLYDRQNGFQSSPYVIVLSLYGILLSDHGL